MRAKERRRVEIAVDVDDHGWPPSEGFHEPRECFLEEAGHEMHARIVNVGQLSTKGKRAAWHIGPVLRQARECVESKQAAVWVRMQLRPQTEGFSAPYAELKIVVAPIGRLAQYAGAGPSDSEKRGVRETAGEP